MRREVTAIERQTAALADSDARSVEALGLPLLIQSVNEIEAKAISAYRYQPRFSSALQVVRRNLTQAIASALMPAMTYSVILAYRRVESMLHRERIETDDISFASSSALVDAASKQARRLNLPVAKVRRLAERTRASALIIAEGASAKAERHIREVMAESVRQGMHVSEGVEALQNAFQTAGLGRVKPFLAETVFRTQTMLAYAAGEQDILADDSIAEFHWGYKYVTVGDDRVRPEHLALEGTTLPKDDPHWLRNLPPNGWNCRCRAIPLFDARPVSRPPATIVVDGNRVKTGADEGFDFVPGEILRAA